MVKDSFLVLICTYMLNKFHNLLVCKHRLTYVDFVTPQHRGMLCKATRTKHQCKNMRKKYVAPPVKQRGSLTCTSELCQF